MTLWGYDQRALDGVLGFQSRRVQVLSTLNNGGTIDMDVRADAIDVTLTQNAVLAIAGIAPSQFHELVIIIRQDATGTWTITWPSSITWTGGSVPVPSTAASTAFAVRLVTTDGGSTWFGVAPAVNSDQIWDAAGDLAIGTGADTAARLAVSTGAGKALAANPNAANKLWWGFPLGVTEATCGQTGALAATYDRGNFASTGTAELSTGRLSVYSIRLPAGLLVANISFFTGGTALSVGVNQWFVLMDSSFNKLAISADDTSTAWAANSEKKLAMGTPYTTTVSDVFFLGIMVKATTVPNLEGLPAGSGVEFTASPKIGGPANSGLTNPASCPSPATFASTSRRVYAEVS